MTSSVHKRSVRSASSVRSAAQARLKFWSLPHSVSLTRFPNPDKPGNQWMAMIYPRGEVVHAYGKTDTAAMEAAMAKMEARHD